MVKVSKELATVYGINIRFYSPIISQLGQQIFHIGGDGGNELHLLSANRMCDPETVGVEHLPGDIQTATLLRTPGSILSVTQNRITESG